LLAYTRGAAYSAGREHDLGQLARGYFADLLVLKADLFTLDPDDIKNVKPERVMVGGEWVYAIE
jgi:hypothetical protein